MAILKDGHIEDNKATPITYWRFRKFAEGGCYFVDKVLRPEAAKDADGNPIICKGIVMFMDGYTTPEARERAKSSIDLVADKSHEFMFFNWVERIEHTRPSTLAEKKASLGEEAANYTDKEIKAMQHDQLESIEEVPHNDFDEMLAAINTSQEADTFYRLAKNGPCITHFFEGAEAI